MPTSVRECFAAAGLTPTAVVPWGVAPSTSESGVYVVALGDSDAAVTETLDEAPLADSAFEAWIQVCPELTIDGAKPTVERLKNRIKDFWIADETILYVGLATNLGSRLGAYYRTPIGARRPHSGGYFLKLLSNLTDLWVHYAPCADPGEAEDDMIRRFCEAVSQPATEALRDLDHPFPFANLEWPRGTRKAHGLRGARQPRRRSAQAAQAASSLRPIQSSRVAPIGRYRTQTVTAADLGAGQIRIPSRGAAPTKSLFPTAKGDLELTLRGTSVHGSWDPRLGLDRERSGVLRIGPALRQLVRAGEQLSVAKADGGLTID